MLNGSQDVVDNDTRIKRKLKTLNTKKNAEREGDYGKAVGNCYGKIKEAQERLDILYKRTNRKQAEGTSLIKEEVIVKILPVVAKWTGIPIMKNAVGVP
jgi:ATP-dependent Clp protease ATP-binding subunit ClpB